MMVLTEVSPLAVMVVTREDVPAAGRTAAGTVMSILVGVSGTGSVDSTVVRPWNSSILLRSSLLLYLAVCFVRAIG
jgi:hypothetical protein